VLLPETDLRDAVAAGDVGDGLPPPVRRSASRCRPGPTPATPRALANTYIAGQVGCSSTQVNGRLVTEPWQACSSTCATTRAPLPSGHPVTGFGPLVRVLGVRHAGHQQQMGEGLMRSFLCGDAAAVALGWVMADWVTCPRDRL
jgi:hypothetical protein